MKCPKCGTDEMTDVCEDCGLAKDSQGYIDAVNLLLDKATEKDEDAEVGW